MSAGHIRTPEHTTIFYQDGQWVFIFEMLRAVQFWIREDRESLICPSLELSIGFGASFTGVISGANAGSSQKCHPHSRVVAAGLFQCHVTTQRSRRREQLLERRTHLTHYPVHLAAPIVCTPPRPANPAPGSSVVRSSRGVEGHNCPSCLPRFSRGTLLSSHQTMVPLPRTAPFPIHCVHCRCSAYAEGVYTTRRKRSGAGAAGAVGPNRAWCKCTTTLPFASSTTTIYLPGLHQGNVKISLSPCAAGLYMFFEEPSTMAQGRPRRRRH